MLGTMQWNYLGSDINAVEVETEVPSELHRAFVDQVNPGWEGAMEMPPKSLATSTNKPCCHFDSAESQRVTGIMIKLRFTEWPSDGLTIMVNSLQFHYMLNLLKLSFISCILLGLKLHRLNTNFLFQISMVLRLMGLVAFGCSIKEVERLKSKSNQILTHKYTHFGI